MSTPESRWKTPFDVRIVGRSMSEVEELAKQHRRSLPSGYRVRVNGFRLVAEVRGKSLDPRLVAELVPQGADTRIVGELNWLATPLLVAMASVFAIASSVATILLGVAGYGVAAAVAGFVAFGWGLLIVVALRRKDEVREAAEEQLREELRLIFFPQARREGLTSLDQLLQEPRRTRPCECRQVGSHRVNQHTCDWAARIAPFDGFVIVTPEYNGGMPGVLKNAIDHACAEWVNKAVGFVSYGVSGGARAVAQLRTVCGALGMADVSRPVELSLFTDFENHTTFVPGEQHAATLTTMLDQVVSWSSALAPLRAADQLVGAAEARS